MHVQKQNIKLRLTKDKDNQKRAWTAKISYTDEGLGLDDAIDIMIIQALIQMLEASKDLIRASKPFDNPNHSCIKSILV